MCACVCFSILLFNTLICHVNAFVGPLEASLLNRFFPSAKRMNLKSSLTLRAFYFSLCFVFFCMRVSINIELLNSKTMSTMSIGFIYLFIYSFAVNHCSSNSNVIVCDATFYFFERMENK